jgi:hypothetical protein
MRHYALLMCIAVAALLALAGSDGWGWFLFVAVLLA